jgi:hypothetical protein
MDNCILSNLVEIQKSLNNSDVMALRDQASKQLSILTDRTTKLWPYLHKDGKYSDNLLNLSIVYDKLFNDFDELIYTKSLIDTEAAETVVVLEKEYLMNSYRQYEDNTDSPDYILERLNDYSLFTDKDDNATLEGRINFHSSWKYPGMHIRPGLGEMTPHMIAFDPLYMVDEDEELFSIIRNQFTKEYQSRIRYKYINEDSEYMFSNIPKCQINFILITDFFNYKPFEVIKRYLTEIYNDVLCDGGSVIFTYNDCDNTAAIINAENNMNSYTPQRLIIPFIEYIGYAHIKSFTSLNLSWVEIKKEGNKKSLRGGQCLAKTINNNIDKI